MNDNPYRKRVDKNQAQIVKALRSYGISVQDLHIIGRGCPDLVCGYKGQNVLIEVKNALAKGKLTEAESRWHQRWGGQVAVVETAEEALALFGMKHNSLLNC